MLAGVQAAFWRIMTSIIEHFVGVIFNRVWRIRWMFVKDSTRHEYSFFFLCNTPLSRNGTRYFGVHYKGTLCLTFMSKPYQRRANMMASLKLFQLVIISEAIKTTKNDVSFFFLNSIIIWFGDIFCSAILHSLDLLCDALLQWATKIED